MNRLYGAGCDFCKVFPGYECCTQIGMPVKWARRGFALFAKALAQCAAEFGGLGVSSGQGIPDSLEILGDLQFLITNLRLCILKKLRAINIASLAATNPEMGWKN